MTKKLSSPWFVFQQKGFKAGSILILNSLSWYFPLFILFTDAINQLSLGSGLVILLFGLHYLSIVCSSFLGNYLTEKIGRNKLLLLWIVLGVCATVLMLLMSSSNVLLLCAVSIILGISLGLGFPSCLAYFENNLSADRKGLYGGVIFALTFVAITIAGFLTTLTSFTVSIIGFSLWRFVGLSFVLFSKTNENLTQTKVSYVKIVKERSFLLYFVPWVIFCMVNFFQAPFFDTQLQTKYLDTNLSYIIALGEFGIGAISMLIGGYLSDRIGRKRVVIAAFAMIGVGYALLSFASDSIYVFYSYIILDGIAWGVFFLMFLLVIWADLAQARAKDRYFLIGVMPFIVASYISPIVTQSKVLVPLSIAFSIASFFLFVAVIPLMVAPETLSEKISKELELKSYAEKALKQAKKDENSAQNENGDRAEPKNDINHQEKEEPDVDEEARKIAEKYY